MKSTVGGITGNVKTLVRQPRSVTPTIPPLDEHRRTIRPSATTIDANPAALTATAPPLHPNLAAIVRKGASVDATVPTCTLRDLTKNMEDRRPRLSPSYNGRYACRSATRVPGRSHQASAPVHAAEGGARL